MTRLAVLVSGTGSILQAMLDQKLPISVVQADRKCRGIEIAKSQGNIHAIVVDRHDFGYRRDIGEDWDRQGFTQAVVAALQARRIDLVAMAGFMTILAEPMFEVFAERILNTHPALLPSFRGERAVADALEAGVKITGCTIHVATIELDSGPILAQASVPVELDDDVDSLHERIKQAERKLYPETLKKLMMEG